MIKITVITCTYNAEKEVVKTLNSVLNQTYLAIEHLIIDGQSKDNTLKIVQAYKEKSDAQNTQHEIKIISEPDKGLYDAMNKGIKNATGTYIIYMNAGDSFHTNNTLAHVAQCAEACYQLPGVLYGNTDIVDENGHFLRHRRLTPPEKLTWKSFKQGMLVCHQAFYARTDLAKQHPYQLKYRYSADVDWCINIMKAAQKQGLSLTNTHTVVANFLDGGMTTKYHKASLKERFKVMQHHYGLITTLLMHVWFAIRSKITK